MLIIKCSDQIGTSRTIAGFRSCRHSTSVSQIVVDQGRIRHEQARQEWREERRLWFKKRIKTRPGRPHL